MYDHIKLQMPVSFTSETDCNSFIKRYGLSEVNESLGRWNNADNKDLKQFCGVYVKLTIKKKRQIDTAITGTLTLSFSLHKFYNYKTHNEPINWDDFSFTKANRAKTMLMDMFPMLDFNLAKVTSYEVGCNVECPTEPERIMQQLSRITIKNRQYNISKDRNFSEYKLYGTHKKTERSRARVTYVWYDKTFEVRSKYAPNKAYIPVSDNIMRIEKDNRIPIQKTMFFDLFKKEFQALTKNEFRKRVIDDVFFKETVPNAVPTILEQRAKSKEQRAKLGITPTEYSFLEQILEKGTDKTYETLDRDYQRGKIPRNTYFRHKREVRHITERLPELKKKLQEIQTIFWQEEYKKMVLETIELL